MPEGHQSLREGRCRTMLAGYSLVPEGTGTLNQHWETCKRKCLGGEFRANGVTLIQWALWSVATPTAAASPFCAHGQVAWVPPSALSVILIDRVVLGTGTSFKFPVTRRSC